jgi:hypothetical protein
MLSGSKVLAAMISPWFTLKITGTMLCADCFTLSSYRRKRLSQSRLNYCATRI